VLTEVEGVRVGHWTDAVARTGCTVVLLPDGTVASGEVRGGAPATRDMALLDPGCLVDDVDAVLLTGGSAFGLAAADGVMRFCAEQGVGFPTTAGPVPIVVALGLFDLTVGDGSVRPGAGEGYRACLAATEGPVELGRVGAGAGSTVGKWAGQEASRAAGLGGAVARHDGVTVAALVAVNAIGDLVDGPLVSARLPALPPAGERFGNTTIGLVVTDARLSKLECHLAARSGHDGLARALAPAHTRFDGDALVAAATGRVDASVDHVRELAALVVEQAVRSGAGEAAPVS
jgi:L-aminopeptidase/D-esterase-like protein